MHRHWRGRPRATGFALAALIGIGFKALLGTEGEVIAPPVLVATPCYNFVGCLALGWPLAFLGGYAAVDTGQGSAPARAS